MRFLSTRNLFHSSFSLCILAHEVKVEVLVAQSCPTLCDPLDCSPPGPSVHKICQARTLEWRAIPFLRGTSWSRDQIQVSHITGRFFTIWATREASTLAHQFSSVQSLSRVQLFATPMNRSTPGLSVHHKLRSSLRLMSIESVMPSSHLILCRPLHLLPPVPPSLRVFSNESALRMRWPKYWSFSFSIIPSREIPGLISFRMDWLDLYSNI